MIHWIKTGFWEKTQKGFKGWLNLNELIQSIGTGGSWGSILGILSNQTDLQDVLNSKASINNPSFTGTPIAPTADPGNNSTQIATTAFVQIIAGGGSISGLTSTRIPYASNPTTLVDTANLTWNNTNAALTIDGVRIGKMPGVTANSGLYIGSGAGVQAIWVTSLGRNTAIGTNALNSLVDGTLNEASFNVAIGYDAGTAMTSGRFNTLGGYRAGALITTGIFNTAWGNDALSTITSQSSNSAFGYNAMRSATCTESVAMGHSAVERASGQRLVGIGWGALALNTTGSYNIGIGSECFQENLTGEQNVGVGFYAGVYVLGSNNVFLGARAAGQAVNHSTSISNCVMIGSGCGVTDNGANASIAGDGNTYVGFQSGLGSTTQVSNSSAFGYRAKVYSSKSMVFGSEIDGDRVNYGFGGESYGGGVGIAFIKNAITVPGSNPTGGGILYVEGGALKYRGSSGTVTILGNA